MDSQAYERVIQVVNEAITSLQALREGGNSYFSAALGALHDREGKIVVTGVGKSGYIGMKLAATFTSLGQFATFVHPVEAMHGDSGSVHNGDVVLALSFSGNTRELTQFLKHIREVCSVTIIGVTGNPDSSLAHIADTIVPVTIHTEGSPHNLAPMASTTAMLVIGDALASGLTSPDTFTKRDFARFHPSGALGLSLMSARERMLPRSTRDMVEEDTPLQEVLVRMSAIGKGLIGVVTVEGRLRGAITDGDIRRFLLTKDTTIGAYAKDVMNNDPQCVEEGHSLQDALSLMESAKITNVFVVDQNGSPVGILHMHDILSS